MTEDRLKKIEGMHFPDIHIGNAVHELVAEVRRLHSLFDDIRRVRNRYQEKYVTHQQLAELLQAMTLAEILAETNRYE